MEDVFESGNIEPLKAMHAAAHGEGKRRYRDESSAAAAPAVKEATVEDEDEVVEAETEAEGAIAKAKSVLGRREGNEEQKRGPREEDDGTTRGATAPSTTPTAMSTSTVDWEAVKAAAVAAPRYNSHVKLRKEDLPQVTWAKLYAYQQREAAQGDCAAAVAIEAILSVAQQLCIRYGYAVSSCDP